MKNLIDIKKKYNTWSKEQKMDAIGDFFPNEDGGYLVLCDVLNTENGKTTILVGDVNGKVKKTEWAILSNRKVVMGDNALSHKTYLPLDEVTKYQPHIDNLREFVEQKNQKPAAPVVDEDAIRMDAMIEAARMTGGQVFEFNIYGTTVYKIAKTKRQARRLMMRELRGLLEN